MSKTKTRTLTDTRTTTTRGELNRAIRRARLTDEEERALRMRAGVSIAAAAPLEFRGQSSDVLASKLAMLEAEALEHVRPSRSAPVPLEGRNLKSAIIEELKKI